MRKRVIVLGLVALILMAQTVGSLGIINAQAAAYSGRGSKADPYLIQTAEQLNGIRDNLNAHYKLANTVDLSGISNFKPIGSLKAPFKGSLTCDTGSNGKPLYAIKNLKMVVSPSGSTLADRYSGYKSDGSSGWEAALFGCVDGSSFTNILIFGADIKNTVEGNYSMNADYSVNPGIDEMAAAILVGIAKSVTISGCGVSGNVTSASNHTGGMVGFMVGGSISRSYSLANVTCTGKWGSGGLLGSSKGSPVNISECYYNGTFSGGTTHAGAFAGSVYDKNTTIKDCWSEGIVKTDSSGCFLGTKNHVDGSDLINVDVASQTYTRSKIEGRTQVPGSTKLTNANYAAKEAGVLEVGFRASTMDEINEAFKAFSAWTVTAGSYPQLKNVILAKAGDYTPGPVTQQTDNGNGQQGSTTGGTDDGTDVTEPDGGQDVTEPDGQGGTEPDISGDESKSTDSPADGDSELIYNSALGLRTAEKVLIWCVGIIIVLTCAGSVITIVLILKKRDGVM